MFDITFGRTLSNAFVAVLAAIVLLASAPHGAASAPQGEVSPQERAVLNFYRLLREKRYAEGFAHSIYRDAFEGLTPADVEELTPDFEATFSYIPDQIEPRGVQVSGDRATVFVAFVAGGDVSPVEVVKVGGEWLVGDPESLAQVQREKGAFFFNQRVRAHQVQVYRLLERMADTQNRIFRAKQQFATLDELAADEEFVTTSEEVEDEFQGDKAYGYRFFVNLTPDRSAYTIVAIPTTYGRTGRLSFFSDGEKIHADDARGMPVNEQAPLLAAPADDSTATP